MRHHSLVFAVQETVGVINICADRDDNHAVSNLHFTVLCTNRSFKIPDITINFFYRRTCKQRNSIVTLHISNNTIKIRRDASAVYIVRKPKRVAAQLATALNKIHFITHVSHFRCRGKT
jgi:hypothetical protein